MTLCNEPSTSSICNEYIASALQGASYLDHKKLKNGETKSLSLCIPETLTYQQSTDAVKNYLETESAVLQSLDAPMLIVEAFLKKYPC